MDKKGGKIEVKTTTRAIAFNCSYSASVKSQNKLHLLPLLPPGDALK